MRKERKGDNVISGKQRLIRKRTGSSGSEGRRWRERERSSKVQLHLAQWFFSFTSKLSFLVGPQKPHSFNCMAKSLQLVHAHVFMQLESFPVSCIRFRVECWMTEWVLLRWWVPNAHVYTQLPAYFATIERCHSCWCWRWWTGGA